jgi:murein DD-endopeptidase MepM/ murein hydrolase activator NlpD
VINRMVPTLATLTSMLLLSACQQEAAGVKVVHKAPGTMLAANPAPEGSSKNLSYFPRWNGGSMQVAQGDKSGPVALATAGRSAGLAPMSNATLPVDYASRTNGGIGTGAGSEAANYYTAQPLPAARIGSAPAAASPAQPFAVASAAPIYTAPQKAGLTAQTAPAGSAARSHAPIPLQASPFGKPSAPLESSVAAVAPAPVAPAPIAPAPTQLAFAAPAPAPMPAAAPVASATYGKSDFARMLNAAPTADDYSGTITLASATAPAAARMAAPAPSMANYTTAAPSLPLAATPVAASSNSTVQQAMAAPVPAGTIRTAAVDESASGDTFVIHADDDASIMHEERIAPRPSTNPNVQQVAQSSSTDMAWPVKGKVISSFGPKKEGKSNDGMNIEAAAGTPIHAAADGMVIYAGNELQGYGNMVVLSHDGNRSTVYAHAQQLKVRKGDFVRKGQIIGGVGQSGGVSKPQLHFAVRDGSNPVDPMPLLQQSTYARN